MAHIGNITFTYINNSPQIPGENVEMWEVVGLDGFGARRIGKRSGKTTLEAVVFNDRATCLLIPQRLAQIMGTIVSVADQLGRSYEMLISEIGNLKISAAIIPGTHVNTMATISVTGVVTSDTYGVAGTLL